VKNQVLSADRKLQNSYLADESSDELLPHGFGTVSQFQLGPIAIALTNHGSGINDLGHASGLSSRWVLFLSYVARCA